MNDPVEFTTEEGATIRMAPDDGKILVRVRMDEEGDGREVMFWLTSDEAQTFINGLVIVNQQPIVGAWGWHVDRPVHIPSYNLGHADAVEEFS